MPEALKDLCEPHFWAILITAAVMVLLFAAGVGLKPLINLIIKWLSKAETEVNINIPGSVASQEEMERHSTKMGEIMADSKNDAFKLSLQYNEKEFARLDKRVDQLWEHHETLEKELLAKIEKLGDDALLRHENLKEGIYTWKKEVLDITHLILAELRGGGK